MSESDKLLLKIQQDIENLAQRLSRIEEDTGSVVLMQGRLFNALNELQASVLKVREALLKVKEKLG